MGNTSRTNARCQKVGNRVIELSLSRPVLLTQKSILQ